jgi:hypothetical protein
VTEPAYLARSAPNSAPESLSDPGLLRRPPTGRRCPFRISGIRRAAPRASAGQGAGMINLRCSKALAAGVLVLATAACDSASSPRGSAWTPPNYVPSMSAAPTLTRSTSSGYDPSWQMSVYISGTESSEPLGDVTRTYVVGGSSGENRLRPGFWTTLGGPCEYTTGTLGRKVFRVESGGWVREPDGIQLAEGDTFKVTLYGMFRNAECYWSWDRPQR